MNQRVTTGYDRLYETTRATTRDWPRRRLIGSLRIIMTKGTWDESWWGAIDAMADLLRGAPPPGRSN